MLAFLSDALRKFYFNENRRQKKPFKFLKLVYKDRFTEKYASLLEVYPFSSWDGADGLQVPSASIFSQVG